MRIVKIYLKSHVTKVVDTVMDGYGAVLKLEKTRHVPVPSKKNQRTPITNPNTGKSFLKSSDQFIAWERETATFWEEQYLRLYNEGVRLPIVKCKVRIMFYFGDDKDRDCTNKAETLMDSLVKYSILANDSFKVVADISMRAFLCKDRPRTEIYITILDPEDPGYDYDVTNYDKYNKQVSDRRKKAYKFKKARIKSN